MSGREIFRTVVRPLASASRHRRRSLARALMLGVILSMFPTFGVGTASAFMYVQIYEADSVEYQVPRDRVRVAPYTPDLRVRVLDQDGATIPNNQLRFDWMKNGFQSSFVADRWDTDQVSDYTYDSPGNYTVVVRATRRDNGETNTAEYGFDVVSSGDTPQPIGIDTPDVISSRTPLCVVSAKPNKALNWAYPGGGFSYAAVPVAGRPGCFRIPVGPPGAVELVAEAWTDSINQADQSEARSVYYTGAPTFGDFRASLLVTRGKRGRQRLHGLVSYTGGERHQFSARIRLQYRFRGRQHTIGLRPTEATTNGNFSEPFAEQKIVRTVNLCSAKFQRLRKKGVRGGRYVLDYKVVKGGKTVSPRDVVKKRFRIPRCGRPR